MGFSPPHKSFVTDAIGGRLFGWTGLVKRGKKKKESEPIEENAETARWFWR
jgi:hypothetical protein